MISISFKTLTTTFLNPLTTPPQGDYTPRPADLRGITLTRGNLEMAEKLAELAHDVWASKKKTELENLGSNP